MSRLGSRIQNLRTKKGMTRKQLAKKLGVAEKYVEEVEVGKKILNENLMNKISKVLGQDINDVSMSFDEQMMEEEKKNKVEYKRPTSNKAQANESWTSAFNSILKEVPVYGYDLNKVIDKKSMPILSNKIEGYSKDKVIFIKVENDDMIGFRIGKGDIAFANLTHEIRNNSICLIEYNGKRAIRQLKTLDSQKVLLINNLNSVRTETANKKSLKVLAELVWTRMEIK